MKGNSRKPFLLEKYNMVTILSKLFIKERENPTAPHVREAYGVLCGALGIFFNLILFSTKFFAGSISGSIAITADAFNNLSDAGSSLISLLGFKLAGQKPDPGHPFGHGRIEYLSGMIVAVAILLMAVELIKSSVAKIIRPETISFSPVIVLILSISIVVKLYMAYYNRTTSRLIHSAAMKATSIDSLSDTCATAVVLAATLICHFTGLLIDGYCGVLVGLFIFYAGFSALKDTMNPLLGQPPEKEFVEEIEQLVLSHEDILGIHDLVVHDYGPGRVMISLHAEVPAKGNLIHLHDTIDLIEHKLQNSLHCEATIHMDPIMNDDPETIALKAQVETILTSIDEALKMHDFRIVKGPTHTNILFDVLVPYSFKMTDAALLNSLQARVRELDATYHVIVEIDKAYL